MLSNLRGHHRLREALLVSFVVTEAAIAPHVDHEVAVKRLTEVDRHLAGERHRLRIIAIHMENGSLHALRNVAGIGRGSGELRRRGEAHLIIDDEMNASARIITANSRKTEAFPDDALTDRKSTRLNSSH